MPFSMQVANFSALTARPDMEICAMPDHKIASIRSPASAGAQILRSSQLGQQARVHFDATLVRITTDTGLVGYGSGDLMVPLRLPRILANEQALVALEAHHQVARAV